MSVFDTVRENVTARQVFEYYGIRVNSYGMCCCPFHSDKHPSMKVDTRYYCFGCGEKGDAVDFVSKYFGLGLKDAAIKICEDFHLSYDESYYAPVKKVTHEKSLLLKFEESEKYVFRVLSDYLHLLKRWKTKYAPKDEKCEWHPCFCEALKETDHVEYMLDILLTGDIYDRAFLIVDYGRKVTEIDRRLKKFRSGDKEENVRSSKTYYRGACL